MYENCSKVLRWLETREAVIFRSWIYSSFRSSVRSLKTLRHSNEELRFYQGQIDVLEKIVNLWEDLKTHSLEEVRNKEAPK
ncbi:hypothetical protein LCGC14_1441190 [marine sediment metagenome]|uniref:Uncharacterized protein n=1 Tax=marine sediment metagenome TaxID=412755 RepID=A0A0F9M186_9ZZZZ